MAKLRNLPDLSALTSAEIAVQVVPGARNDAVEWDGVTLRIRVTAPAEKGQANAAVQAILAKALGVPKSSLTLIRGHTARSKVFRR